MKFKINFKLRSIKACQDLKISSRIIKEDAFIFTDFLPSSFGVVLKPLSI